jgi:hypothetical protein
MNFNDLFWHDATLLSIYIDRKNPGKKDIVQLEIEWPTETLSIIEFYDCYLFNVRMNFGVVASESILEAECIIDSKEIHSIREEWLKMEITLENLKCYRIITNSTNSIIDIFSMGFRIL